MEIELKLKVKQPKKLVSWLKKHAKFISKSHQIDYYFNPPKTNYIYFDKQGNKLADDYLRIRVDPQGDSITFKRKVKARDDTRGHMQEFETRITDSKSLLKIFSKVGFTKIATLDKHRTSYAYNHFQFDCDDVKNLGYFVEVELKAKVTSAKAGFLMITDLLSEIGIEWEEAKGGYLQIMWNKGREVI